MLKIQRTRARRSGFLSTVAVMAALVAVPAFAQSLRNAQGPAELPPSSFTSNQYVDSRGCVFVRAGINGTTNWVPRVSRSRDQLCGFAPSLVAQAPAPVAPDPVVTTTTQTAAAALAPAPTPAIQPSTVTPVAAAAPVTPDLNVRPDPVVTPVAAQAASPAPAAPSPRVIEPAPVVAAQVAPPAASAASPPPRIMTRAQACNGRSGIQPNMISQSTGDPIDCGPAAPAQVVTAAVENSAPLMPSDRTRLTRAQACADMATSGRRYMSAVTGRPLVCGPLAGLRAGLALPSRPYSNPLEGPPGTTILQPLPAYTASLPPRRYSNPLDTAPGSTFVRNMNTQIGAPDCGYISTSTGTYITGCGADAPSTVTHARTARSSGNGIAQIFRKPAPYSNPTNTYALAAPEVPDGYERVWNDGRLNPHRGLPSTSYATSGDTVTYATAPRASTEAARVSTRTAPQSTQRAEQLSGHRYVQVTTSANRDQAQAIAQALRARGLPMRIGVFEQNGQQMRIVLAGPFGTDSQLQDALGTARGAGYSGAFTRQ